MLHGPFTFLLIFAFLDLAHIVCCKKPWCVAGKTRTIDCNTCWCFNDGVPVCTKIPCDAVKKQKEDDKGHSIKPQKRFLLGAMLGLKVFVSMSTFCGYYAQVQCC